MKQFLCSVLLLAMGGLTAQTRVVVRLDSLNNDRVPVVVYPAKTAETLIYQLPKMVPGTYKIYNFGRFISGVTAVDKQGKSLPVEQLDTNRWKISNAKNLSHIRYLADDTYDMNPKSGVFEPAGTSFETDVFLLNLFTLAGYFDGQGQLPIALQVSHPAGFYGATALHSQERGAVHDDFKADHYFHLHDSPILYAKPDTTSVQVANARVEVAVFSPNREVTSKEIAKVSSDVLQAAATYLKGQLPTDYYGILVYLAGEDNQSVSGFGALEHHRSTVVVMPEDGSEEALVQLRDIVAHEFLHIVTPLTLHSEYVHNFDFMNPEMSKHLWLYEGVTEYTSHLIQVRAGITTIRDFLSQMREKMLYAERFNTYLPMTVTSQFNLSYFGDEYLNVYNKGALLGMGLDMELRRRSSGKMGLGDLIAQMGQTYGPDTFFVDDQLFDLMTAASFPQVREYFARYVEGAEPLPYEALFYDAGIDYIAEERYQRNSFGNVSLNYNPATQRIFIDDVSELDAYGQALGFEVGDEILTINGWPFDLNTYESTADRYRNEIKPGQKVTWEVARPDGNGGFKTKKLKAAMIQEEAIAKHQFRIKSELTPEQKTFRKSWLNTLE
jgi:predicted metalloprotease with PDZ domain